MKIAKIGGMKRVPAVASFAAMNFDALLDLRTKLDAVIADRIRQEERELETKLASLKKIRRGDLSGSAKVIHVDLRKGRKLPPKYRNPKNKAQTWAGRGLQPRWLTDALKSGRKLEDFAV